MLACRNESPGLLNDRNLKSINSEMGTLNEVGSKVTQPETSVRLVGGLSLLQCC